MTAASGADQPTPRDQLIARLTEAQHAPHSAIPVPDGLYEHEIEAVIDALLPLIEAREARAKAEGGAEALEKAANDYLFDDGPNARGMAIGDWLDDRAAALRATTGLRALTEDGDDMSELRWADQLPPEARALVRDPNDRLWLLGDDGRVNRPVKPEELESWAEYEQPQPKVVGHTAPEELGGPEIELVMPARYVGIPFSISRVSWAEFARLGGPPPGPPNPPRAPHDRPYA